MPDASAVLPPVAPRPDPPDRSARQRQILDVAGRVLDAEGRDAITMRRLAAEIGIKAPSLYKHVAGKATVEAWIVDDELRTMGEAGHAAIDGAGAGDRGASVRALLATYRGLARARPHRYRLTTAPIDRSLLTPGVEDWAGETFWRVAGEPHRAQALWAFAHGTAILEIDQRFADAGDLDATWEAGAAAFTTG